MTTGKLYIVPTPVGNMSDMTPRAVEVLKTCSLIYAEDTRTSGVLLRHFGIDTPCASHHKFNEHATVRPIIDRLLAGETIALISDAGTPGISDPGFLLTRECRRENIEVETLPRPNGFRSSTCQLRIANRPLYFRGAFSPKKGRRTRLERIAANDCTSIIYESPLRLVKTLGELIETCGADRPASVSREVSKLHDTTHRGTLGELQAYFAENNPRGEIVVIVGAPEDSAPKVHKTNIRTFSNS